LNWFLLDLSEFVVEPKRVVLDLSEFVVELEWRLLVELEWRFVVEPRWAGCCT
jgi:hypothetical protein